MPPPHGLPVIGVLADDAIGALASAVRIQQRGLRAVVQFDPHHPQSAEALVVNMGTRARSASASTTYVNTPFEIAKAQAAQLQSLGCARFELRVDSLFRGHHSAELKGLLAG